MARLVVEYRVVFFKPSFSRVLAGGSQHLPTRRASELTPSSIFGMALTVSCEGIVPSRLVIVLALARIGSISLGNQLRLVWPQRWSSLCVAEDGAGWARAFSQPVAFDEPRLRSISSSLNFTR